MNPKEFIRSLGIERDAECPHCGKSWRRTIEERRNMADCMTSNHAGLWVLDGCPYCGWLNKIYPVRINNIPCTPEECDRLSKELKRYEEAHR